MRQMLFLLAALSACAQTFGTFTNPVNGAPVARVSYLRSMNGNGNMLGDPTLIGWWPMADPADQAYDYSGHNLTAVFGGSTTSFVNTYGAKQGAPNFLFCPNYCGQINAAAPYFAHNNPNWMLTPAITIPPATWTVSAWVKPNTSSGLGYARIAELASQFSSGFYLGMDTTGTKFQLFVNTGGSTPTTCIYGTAWTAGVWYLLTATFNAGAATVYVNSSASSGSTSCTYTTPTTANMTSQTLRVGCGYGSSCSGTYGGFNGQIQDVRVYGRVLSSAEINAIYAAESKPH